MSQRNFNRHTVYRSRHSCPEIMNSKYNKCRAEPLHETPHLKTESWRAQLVHFSKMRTRENNPTPETHQGGKKKLLKVKDDADRRSNKYKPARNNLGLEIEGRLWQSKKGSLAWLGQSLLQTKGVRDQRHRSTPAPQGCWTEQSSQLPQLLGLRTLQKCLGFCLCLVLSYLCFPGYQNGENKANLSIFVKCHYFQIKTLVFPLPLVKPASPNHSVLHLRPMEGGRCTASASAAWAFGRGEESEGDKKHPEQQNHPIPNQKPPNPAPLPGAVPRLRRQPVPAIPGERGCRRGAVASPGAPLPHPPLPSPPDSRRCLIPARPRWKLPPVTFPVPLPPTAGAHTIPPLPLHPKPRRSHWRRGSIARRGEGGGMS